MKLAFRSTCYALLALFAVLPAAGAEPVPAGSGSGVTAPSSIPDRVENAVVKIFVTKRFAEPYKPWTKQPPSEATASGVVIEGKRILTNAHVVLYASQVQIQGNQEGDKLPATVIAVAPGIDLAVLKLEDESFFDNHKPLPRANTLPEIKDSVLAYGFPTGGSSMSITKGIVSRIEFAAYNFPVSGLRIQIDAAINPGNSGGPAIAGNNMIGLAYSYLSEAQNIGYIIPNEEVELFLQDIADGRYDGKPGMYDDLQTFENPALRTFLKLDKTVEGIIVHRPAQDDASYPLKEWDVITRIGKTPVDNEGMIKLGSNLRVSFRYMVQKIARNGKVPLTIVRAGKSMQVDLPVSPEKPMLIYDLKGDYPSYFIYGPLVFSNATWSFVSPIQRNAATMKLYSWLGNPLVTRYGDNPDAEAQELVAVSSPFFPHKLARGYSNPAGSVVYSVNGARVHSLHHLVALLRDIKDDYVIFQFDQHTGEALVFSRKEVADATEEILNDNGVRAQGSPDMLEVWRGAK
jgi:S1-C subfamily serine protease